MSRERTMAGTAAVVFAVALLAATVTPGVLANPSNDGPLRPGPVQVAEVDVAPGDVSGRTANLQLLASVAHRGNPTDNVTVRFRAVDAESGLVETTRSVEVGTLTDDGETPLNVTLPVEREGGYHIETVVFRDGERVDRKRTSVNGLEALTPEYARTGVGFDKDEVFPPVSVAVTDAGEDRTTLRVGTLLTNEGDEASQNLRMTLVLRQADSNLVADETTVDVGQIRPGRTERVDASVTVPSEYNYYVDAVLWKDGVRVDTVRSVVNLDPSERISANETEKEVELKVSDFESDTDSTEQRRNKGDMESVGDSAGATPGFGAVVAVVALLASALFIRRWSA